jgi:hypothetical protein
MPSSATRFRINWCPGDAALEAVQIAERMYPHLRRQEVIDRLVLTGLWALKPRITRRSAFIATMTCIRVAALSRDK